MSLSKKALSRQGMSDRGASNHTCFYYYSSNDTAAELLAAGYFNGVRDILSVGDIIHAVADIDGTPDYLNIMVATVPDTGNVTTSAQTGASGA